MRRQEFLTHQILLLLAVAPFLPAILDGNTLYGHDTQSQFQIWQGHTAQEILEGTFPQWNPYLFTGTPLAANPQVALFYPANLLFLIVPPAQAVPIFFLLHTYLSILGSYLFCRGHNLSRIPCLFAAIVYGWGGFSLGQIAAGHLTIVASFPWIPLLLGTIDRWSKERRPIWILTGTLFSSFLLLSGHPQTVYLGGLLAVAYGVRRILLSHHRLPLTIGLLVMAMNTILLVAIQWVPTAHFLAETGRSHTRIGSFQSEASLPPENLATYLLPDLFGGLDPSLSQDLASAHPSRAIPPYTGRSYWWEVGTYLGVIPLLLIFIAFWIPNRRPQPMVRFFIGVVLLALLLSLGDATPFHQLAMKLLPGLSLFRVPARTLLLVQLAIAFLTALAAQRLLENSPPIGITLASVALIILTNLLLAWVPLQATDLNVNPIYHQHLTRTLCITLGLLLASFVFFAARSRGLRPEILLILLLVLTTGDLLSRAAPRLVSHNPKKDRWPTWLIDYLHTNLGPQQRLLVRLGHRLADLNDPLTHKIHSVGGYDPAIPRLFHDIAHRAIREDGHPLTLVAPGTLAPWLRAMAVSHILRTPGTSTQGQITQEYQVVSAPFPPLPRARLVHEVTVLEPEQILDRMMNQHWNPEQEVFVDRPPPFTQTPLETPSPTSRVTFTIDRETEIQLEVETNRPGLLVLADTYTRGWKAEIDGLPTPIVPVMHWARGVYVQPGLHTVRFHYRLPGLRLGAFLSLLGGFLWIAGALGWLVRRKRLGHEPNRQP